MTYGYIKETRSCGTCDNDKVYDFKTRSCIPCPCGDDCLKLENEIWSGESCLSCPVWMKNNGNNQCEDKCDSDKWWDDVQKKCVKDYNNNCKTTGTDVFKESIGHVKSFDEQCKRKCSSLDIHMSIDPNSQNPNHNPFFPRGIRCCDGENCGTFHGQNDAEYSTITVGMEDSCIYKIEIQE